jgi:hypothetical protein
MIELCLLVVSFRDEINEPESTSARVPRRSRCYYTYKLSCDEEEKKDIVKILDLDARPLPTAERTVVFILLYMYNI